MKLINVSGSILNTEIYVVLPSIIAKQKQLELEEKKILEEKKVKEKKKIEEKKKKVLLNEKKEAQHKYNVEKLKFKIYIITVSTLVIAIVLRGFIIQEEEGWQDHLTIYESSVAWIIFIFFCFAFNIGAVFLYKSVNKLRAKLIDKLLDEYEYYVNNKDISTVRELESNLPDNIRSGYGNAQAKRFQKLNGRVMADKNDIS